jgi:crossover junction endodeoxyribonuclease RusA
MVESSRHVKAWRETVRAAAHAAHDGAPLAGPVNVHLVFRAARPKAHWRVAGRLAITAPRRPTTRPDVDKLARAVLDALTGVVFTDDSQVVELVAIKRYATAEHGPGVHITVESL